MKSLLLLFSIIISNLPYAFGQLDNFAEVRRGTGFALTTNGYIATNYHVVYDNDISKTGDLFTITQVRNGERVGYLARLVSADENSDLAILKVIDPKFRGFPALPYSVKFSTADKGADVFTLGYPRTDIQGFEVKVTKGNIVAQTGYRGDVGHYTISASIDHGSSGGPLFDSNGDVIGITDRGLDIESSKSLGRGAISTSQFYAIKASKLQPMLDLFTDVVFTKKNTIAVQPFTKKVKALENYVFIVSTYVKTEEDIQHEEQKHPKNNITNEITNSTRRPQELAVGSFVRFAVRKKSYIGKVTKITSSSLGSMCTIIFKNMAGVDEMITLSVSRVKATNDTQEAHNEQTPLRASKNIEVGSIVYFRKAGMNRNGEVVNIVSGGGIPLYTIAYKKVSGTIETIKLKGNRLSLSPQ